MIIQALIQAVLNVSIKCFLFHMEVIGVLDVTFHKLQICTCKMLRLLKHLCLFLCLKHH